MNHTRHANIYNIPPGFSVTLIGAGGIGATTALALAKMGVRNMIVFDDDVVGEENLATQLHKCSDIGKQKVDALEETLAMFTDELEFLGKPVRISRYDEIRSSLVISAVDTIQARKEIWAALQNSQWEYYLDARMAAEELQCFLVDRNDSAAMQRYNESLARLSDDTVEELPCTMKATFFCAMTVAGHIGAELRNIVRGEAKSRRVVYYISQSTIYNLGI